jgi:hypothetical protein
MPIGQLVKKGRFTAVRCAMPSEMAAGGLRGAGAKGKASEFRRVAGIVARAVAAIGGGYALALLAAVALALVLPLSRLDAVLTGRPRRTAAEAWQRLK